MSRIVSITLLIASFVLGAIVSPVIAKTLSPLQGTREINCHLGVCVGSAERVALERLRAYPAKYGGFEGFFCAFDEPEKFIMFPDFLEKRCSSGDYGLSFTNTMYRTVIFFQNGSVSKIKKSPINTLDF